MRGIARFALSLEYLDIVWLACMRIYGTTPLQFSASRVQRLFRLLRHLWIPAKIESGLYISSHTSDCNGFRNPKHYDRPARYSNAVGNATLRDTVTLPEKHTTVAATYETAQTFEIRYLRATASRTQTHTVRDVLTYAVRKGWTLTTFPKVEQGIKKRGKRIPIFCGERPARLIREVRIRRWGNYKGGRFCCTYLLS
jgi:hypothetical protein